MQQINSVLRFLGGRYFKGRDSATASSWMRKEYLWLLVLTVLFFMGAGCQPKAFLYTSFHEPASKGLRFLFSKDGYHWDSLPGIFLAPEVGTDKIMRDPSMVQGPDGVFHLVWTLAWKGNAGFGYASSKDLIHWSAERVIPVMADHKNVVNVWAPELFYRKSEHDFIIVWASTIPYKFKKGLEQEDNNHRLYYTVTRDFDHFSAPALYYDPGYSSIDATLVQRGKQDFVLVFKDNTRNERDIKVAFGKSALGPFIHPSKTFTPTFSEGPSVLKTKGAYLIYYDWYRQGKFGAARTKDFIHFENITDQVEVPKGHKHGTIVPVSGKFLKLLRRQIKAAKG